MLLLAAAAVVVVVLLVVAILAEDRKTRSLTWWQRVLRKMTRSATGDVDAHAADVEHDRAVLLVVLETMTAIHQRREQEPLDAAALLVAQLPL